MDRDEYLKTLVVVPLVSFIGWMILYGKQPHVLTNAASFSAFVFMVIAIFGRM